MKSEERRLAAMRDPAQARANALTRHARVRSEAKRGRAAGLGMKAICSIRVTGKS